jgi:hypothetical protein
MSTITPPPNPQPGPSSQPGSNETVHPNSYAWKLPWLQLAASRHSPAVNWNDYQQQFAQLIPLVESYYNGLPAQADRRAATRYLKSLIRIAINLVIILYQEGRIEEAPQLAEKVIMDAVSSWESAAEEGISSPDDPPWLPLAG